MAHEDDTFRRKIIEVHKKLSDVDEESRFTESQESSAYDEATTNRREHRDMVPGRSSVEHERLRQRRLDAEYERRRQLSRNEESSEEEASGSSGERNFLSRFRIKRRSSRILSFFSGKSSMDKQQDERTTRLLKGYTPDKSAKSQNTISIHTSRDRRFWKLRNRRRSSSK